MPACSFKTRLMSLLAVAAIIVVGCFSTATVAKAATGLDFRGTVTISAYYTAKDVVWKVDGVEYGLGRSFMWSASFDGFVIDGDYIATDGHATKAGLAQYTKTEGFKRAFRESLELELVDSGDYQPGSEQLRQALKTAQPDGAAKFSHYAVTGVGIGEQYGNELEEVAAGTNSKKNGYPAIFRLKGLKVPYYQVRASANFDGNLWPLSSRFNGNGPRSERIQRLTDKYGKDMYPYFQVLMADNLVPGTQVVDKTAPREIRGMIGAGDYEWGNDADALYPMNAWIDLARAHGVEVHVAGEISAPSALPSASPSASTPPSVMPSTPSASSQPNEPAQQNTRPEWLAPVLLLVVTVVMIALVGVIWLGVLRSRKRAVPVESESEPFDEHPVG